jgi:hypothetical protein
MEKMFLINECAKSTNPYFVDKQSSLCDLQKSKQIEDTTIIPIRCPLPDALFKKERTKMELSHS